MPSLKKRPGSPFYVCCYTKADGERSQRSTKQAVKEKAWEVCLAWSRAEAAGRAGALTEAAARKVIAEIVERTTGQPLVFHSVEEWLKDWLAGKSTSKAAGTFTRYKTTIDGFIAHLGDRARLSLAHVTPKDIQTFRDLQLQQGKTGQTANLTVKYLRIPFNVARRQGIIQSNPAEAVDMVETEPLQRDVFTADQISSLISAASPDWRTAILLAYYTGARLGDVTGMRWSQIDLTSKLIRFRPGKTKRKKQNEIVVPIHPELESHLMSLSAPDDEKSPVMPSLFGKGTGGKSGLSSAFARLMEAAKIRVDVAREAKGKGRTVKSLSFHSLRHTFTSAMANGGVSIELRQKLTGHASPEMNKIYTHHEIEPLRAAVEVIPSIRIASPAGEKK